MPFCSRPVGRLAGATACTITLIFAFAAPRFARASAPVSHRVSAPQPLLPSAFAGWAAAGAEQTSASAPPSNAVNAAVLKEFGLKGFAQETYQRDGASMNVHALRFADATGAYGAYTFYRQPDMKPAFIGRNGAVGARKAIFWTGATVVIASFPDSAAGSESALRALAARLPRVGGDDSVAPPLPRYLPLKGLDISSIRYAIGPVAYTAGGGVLPPSEIHFNREAEAVTARYAVRGGAGVLTLLEFPTPQMAAATENHLIAFLKGPLPAALASSAPGAFAVRRSGPLVAMTSGAFSTAEARALLDQVKFQTAVTWSDGPAAGRTAIHETAEMLIGIAAIVGISIVIILVLGILFGGGRALWRVMHGKPASTMYEQEFISLNLNGWQPGPPRKLP